MKQHELPYLIEKYKNGKCSPKEIKLVEKYLDSFQGKNKKWDENILGQKLQKQQGIYSKISNKINKSDQSKIRYNVFSPALMNKAASIIFFLIMLTGGLYLFNAFEFNKEVLMWNEKVTALGEKAVVKLSDGSTVILNAGSKLKYPEYFNDDYRNVYLDGEAYFEVARNSKHPFNVHAKNISTSVLGTKFNVSAYEENRTIAVSLLEGKVKVSKNNGNSNIELAVLKPKEKLIYDKMHDTNTFAKYDSLEIIGWKEDIYKFNNIAISEVLTSMQRVYNVEFVVTNQAILKQNITIRFENNSLETMIDVINKLTGLKANIKESNNKKVVLFY